MATPDTNFQSAALALVTVASRSVTSWSSRHDHRERRLAAHSWSTGCEPDPGDLGHHVLCGGECDLGARLGLAGATFRSGSGVRE